MMTHHRETMRLHSKGHGLHPMGPHRGFTLVEMLVSVALVVIMMAMFATVFQLAAGSVGTQKGIAENDQRARSATILIRSDLSLRSTEFVVPFDRGETAPASADPDFNIRDFARRQGYFYISDNDPDDDTDDVLQFTALLPGTSGDFFVGRSVELNGLSTTTNFANSNEPDRDDGNPTSDSSSESPAAEISYFLRDGRLYRRMQLIRAPLSGSFADTQPTDATTPTANNYFDPTNDGMAPNSSLYTGNFWSDFDFSAHFGVDAGGTSTGAVFHDIEYLDNTTNNTKTAQVGSGLVPAVLGDPRFRFGHNQVDGLPREFVGTSGGATNNQFIGRFTHEETSFGFFKFPQKLSEDASSNPINDGNPMEQNATTRQLNLVDGIVTDSTGVVFNGPRRAEDLLLSNVHAFDVKVWDEAVDTDGDTTPDGEFVDVGHAKSTGDYRLAARQNSSYGPNGPKGNRVFDTWRPDLDLAGDMTNDLPPFRPVDASSNPKRLRAIQITIRFLDISSNQLRQLTLQVSLMN